MAVTCTDRFSISLVPPGVGNIAASSASSLWSERDAVAAAVGKSGFAAFCSASTAKAGAPSAAEHTNSRDKSARHDSFETGLGRPPSADHQNCQAELELHFSVNRGR
jgi:hypothetical protein